MNQQFKDLILLTILVQAYEDEYGKSEKLVNLDWFSEKILEVFGVDTNEEIDGDQLEIDMKFYVNYEIQRLKDKLEKGYEDATS
jgi:hypothetical protein